MAGVLAALTTLGVVAVDGRMTLLEWIAVAIAFVSGTGLAQSVVNNQNIRTLRMAPDLRLTAANKADLVNGRVPLTQLPALALTDTSVVDDLAARDALTALDEGDVAIVRNNGDGVRESFIYTGEKWASLASPVDVTEAELAAAVQAGLRTVTNRIDRIEIEGMTRTGDRFGRPYRRINVESRLNDAE